MNRTIVCTSCDNNRVIIQKIGQELYFKCSRCKNTIIQAVHLESWNKNADIIYRLRISMEDDRLLDAIISEREFHNRKPETSKEEDIKIRLVYDKRYGYIRQLEEDEST